MSWDAYVERSLVDQGELIDRAAIFGVDGKSVWSCPDKIGYKVSFEELAEVVAAYNDKGEFKKVASTGIHLGGEKFIVTRADDRSLYGAKGKEGVIIVKTTQAILIAHYTPKAQAGNISTTVEGLADYLIKAGY